MTVTYRTDKEILYNAPAGRIDASNAGAAEEQIAAIRRENPGLHTVVDADKLEYISSAGLRVILKLRKEEPKLAIINVSPEVYEIFDMTGFTEMVTVEKAFRRLSIEGCEFIARGANGAVYRYDAETIVKTYHAPDALPEIRQERENARKAFVMGINTAIPYGIVRVGDGYGTVTELLNAVNVTRLICDDPTHLEQPVKYYIDLLKSIHAIDAEPGQVPDMKQTALSWAAFTAQHLPEDQGKKLVALMNAVPERNTLLHGDYHTNNIMVQNGEPLLIDMDTLCMGHPIFELGSMFNAFLGYSSVDHTAVERFMGYNYQTAQTLWDMCLQRYLGTEDPDRCREVAEKAMIVGYTRILRRSVRRPNEPESPAMIAYSKKILGQLLARVDSLDF